MEALHWIGSALLAVFLWIAKLVLVVAIIVLVVYYLVKRAEEEEKRKAEALKQQKEAEAASAQELLEKYGPDTAVGKLMGLIRELPPSAWHLEKYDDTLNPYLKFNSRAWILCSTTAKGTRLTVVIEKWNQAEYSTFYETDMYRSGTSYKAFVNNEQVNDFSSALYHFKDVEAKLAACLARALKDAESTRDRRISDAL